MNDQHDGDIETARQFRMGLLPRSALRFGSWEVAGCLVPMRDAGNDSFDYYALGDGRYAICIATVLGTSTLLVSNLHSSLRAHSTGHRAFPEMMKRLNESVARAAAFASMFYGEFDAERGVLRYSSADSYPLLRRRDGSLVELDKGGLLLGILENEDYIAAELPIEAGDSLLLYSDGITNALDPLKWGWGQDRLRAIWQRRGGIAPGEAIAGVLADVQAFRDRALLGKVEALPTVAEGLGSRGPTDLELLRVEAQQLRSHTAQADDMTLVMLGMHEQS